MFVVPSQHNEQHSNNTMKLISHFRQHNLEIKAVYVHH